MKDLKVGTKRDLGEGFYVEVLNICKDMQGYIDVVFSNGRHQLYLKSKLFWKLDFEDKRNSRVKDRTGDTMTKSDGTKLTVINYVDCTDVDILVRYTDNTVEVLTHKNIAWFNTGLYESVPYTLRRYGKRNAKKKEQPLVLEGVIQSQRTEKNSNLPKVRLEQTIGGMYETSVGRAMILSCSRHGATVVDNKGEVHRLDLEDITW